MSFRLSLVLALMSPGCLFLAEQPTSIKLLEDDPDGAFMDLEDGQVVYGEWPLEVELVSTLEVEGTLYIDDDKVEDGEGPGFGFAWDTTEYDRGEHVLRLEVQDEVDRDEDVELVVVVDQLPEVTITEPEDGETFEGLVSVRAETEDDGDVEQVALLLDEEELAVDSGEAWYLSFDTCDVESGEHLLALEATDDAGNIGRSEITISTTRPLSVELELGRSLLRPEVSVGATVQWDAGLERLSFLVDGDEVLAFTDDSDAKNCSGECTGRCSTYEGTFDGSGLAEGDHVLEVIWEDSSGRTVSDSADVEVDHDQDDDGEDAEGYGGGDCDDSDDSIGPGFDEVCDGQDNDCDGDSDEGFDADGDGAPGDPSCDPDEDWADCDDTDPEVSPDAEEICDDGIDNDCDGPDAACRTTGELDVDDAALAWWDGPTEEDFFAQRLMDAGDIDGDGTNDLLMGSYVLDLEDNGRDPNGGWYLVSGDVGTGEQSLDDAMASIISASEDQFFGFAGAALGDINGDGYDDIALGEPYVSSNKGGINLYLGPVSGALDTTDKDAFLSHSSSYFTGRYLTAGDFDRDDIVDLVSGACIGSYSGTTVLWYSAPDGDYDSTPSSYASDANAAAAGCVVENMGDVSGDGRADLLIAGPEDSTYTDEAGGAWLLPDMPSSGYDLQDHAESFIRGTGEGSQVGWEVAAVGDVDDDGYNDVLIGGEYYSDGDGGAWLFLGPLDSSEVISAADTTFVGTNGAVVGQGLAATDYDGDGTLDIAVGAPVHTATSGRGAVALFYSPPPSGTLDVPADGDIVVNGDTDAGFLGAELEGVSDLDGDGAGELLISAPELGADYAGRVYLLLGDVAD